jgi:hypothetical protein
VLVAWPTWFLRSWACRWSINSEGKRCCMPWDRNAVLPWII